MQIRARLTLQFILIVASILFFSLFTIYYFSEKHREIEFHTQLRNKAITTAELLIKVQEVDSTLLKIIDKSKKDVLHLENISVYNYKNEEIYTNNDTIRFSKLIPDINNAIDRVRLRGEISVTSGEMEIIGLPYIDRFNRFVVIAGAVDRQGLNNIKNLKRILIAVFFIMLIAVGVAGWIYAGRALSPISKVINEVSKISETSLDLRLEEGNRKDEIELLSSTFNKMLERIEKAFKVQKTFIANASHELRNPLTKITAQLEVALLNERKNEEYKKIISSVLDDIKNLNDVAHRLLQLAKISSIQTDLRFTPLRLDDVIWETKNEFLSQHPDCKINFFLNDLPEQETKLIINANAAFLKICFLNLIENACKFSPDKTVTIKLLAQQQQLTVVFEDKGIGIDQNDLPHIFQPFYRSKNATPTIGYGIGLSLAHKIILLHKAKILVSSQTNKGTSFTLIFPL